jgi:fructokinase
MSKYTIVGLGEVLWDVFPAYKQLGGAPANFAYISSLLGDEAVAASRIGADHLGTEVVNRFASLGLSTSYLQRDGEHRTGIVNVEIGKDGQPRFEIVRNVAWDFIGWNSDMEALAARADAVCFGSLAQREAQSRATIQRFVSATRKDALRVFDVNLRQSFYSAQVLIESAEKCEILKLNHEEVPVMMKMLGGPELAERDAAKWIEDRFQLKLVCVTRGAQGSLLVTPEGFHEHPGHRVQVADTVGAGDAFTATLVHHYLRGTTLAEMNDAANRVGAWVASKPGATPLPDAAIVEYLSAHS